VKGWWVDGAYAPEQRYPEDEAPNYKTLGDALRAGNNDAIVAFNTGVRVPVVCTTHHEDFTAGELSGDLPVGCFGFGDNSEHANYGPIRSFVDGARFHVLNFLGQWWAASPPRFPIDLVAGYTRYIIRRGGVVTWDAPISKEGRIPDEFIDQLNAVDEACSRGDA